MFFITAKVKLLKLRVHKTGGGPAPKPLTKIKQAIERILGKMPEFTGVVQEAGNSKDSNEERHET